MVSMKQTQTSIDPQISYVIENDMEAYRNLFLSICTTKYAYSKDTIFSRSGEISPQMYFLLEGIVKVYTVNPNGYIRILGYHRNNTFFAMDSLCGEKSAVVTIESITPVEVLPVSWQELRAAGKADPRFMEDLVRYYGSVLRLMCFDAESNSVCDASARLATFLCLFLRYRRQQGDTRSNAIFLTQDELASAVNASRIQIARICADFKNKGLIQCARGAITVLDQEGLEKISKYGGYYAAGK